MEEAILSIVILNSKNKDKMKMKTLKLSMLAFSALMIGLTSCGKKDNNTITPVVVVTKTDTIYVPFSATSPNTFFSFSNGTVVANSDSASTKWDFGLRYVNFIFNSNASGPGNAGVIVSQGLYDTFTMAPASGYAYDTTSANLAIPFDVNNGWFIYNQNTHAFSPKAGEFFVIRTADNHYVKMELLSVGYEPFTGQVPVTLIYIFSYTYQPDGSRNF